MRQRQQQQQHNGPFRRERADTGGRNQASRKRRGLSSAADSVPEAMRFRSTSDIAPIHCSLLRRRTRRRERREGTTEKKEREARGTRGRWWKRNVCGFPVFARCRLDSTRPPEHLCMYCMCAFLSLVHFKPSKFFLILILLLCFAFFFSVVCFFSGLFLWNVEEIASSASEREK